MGEDVPGWGTDGAADANERLQSAILSAIAAAQSDDPLAPVTLLVDSSAQGWALRRQIAARLAPGSALANVRTLTVGEFMGRCATGWGLPEPTALDDVVRTAITGATLATETGPLSLSAAHPDSAIRLTRLADELQWCLLDEPSLASLATAGASSTSRQALAFIAHARSALAAAVGPTTWVELTGQIEEAATRAGGVLPASVHGLGSIVVVAHRVPTPVLRMLALLERSARVEHVAVHREALEPAEATVIDCPDPASEVSIAVRHVAAALAGGAAPSNVALVYSAQEPYASLLASALDDAQIAWHGPTGVALAATAVAQFATCLAGMAAGRTATSSGISRTLLMRWLAIGRIHDGTADVHGAPLRALIREQGLYGDARSWTPRLRSLIDEATDHDPDDGEDDYRSRQQVRIAAYASTLERLLNRLDTTLELVSASRTWTELGACLWNGLESFHLQGGWWKRSDAERAAHDVIRTLLVGSLPSIDAHEGLVGSSSEARASELPPMLARALVATRAMHGSSGTGIHIGPVTSTRGLVFSHVVVVGGAEGLLPRVAAPDPLLPDDVRVHLRACADDLPTSLEVEAATALDVAGVCRGAQRVVVTIPRGAIASRAVAAPSRYFAPQRDSRRVPSARTGLKESPDPVTALDLAMRTGIGSADAPAYLSSRVESLRSWARPAFDVHFGRIGVVDNAPAWNSGDAPLSASAIRQYLHCPYHFFVARVLDVTTDEYTDEVDVMPASDFGTMVHRVLEQFVNEARDAGTLPGPGHPWPDVALGDLEAILAQSLDDADAAGLTGWRPQWERTRAQLLACLPDFLAVDDAQVRRNPPVTPIATEQRFGYDGEPAVEIPLTDGAVARLRGSIDRVDADTTGQHIGVVDYKTGKAEGFGRKLGVGTNPNPDEREEVQDLVYDAAARALHPGATDIDVRFVFLPNRGDGVDVLTVEHEPDPPARLLQILDALQSAGSTGSYPPKPRNSDYCPVCRRLGRAARKVAGLADVDDDDDEQNDEQDDS